MAVVLTTYEKIRRFLATQGMQSFVDEEEETVNDEIALTTAEIAGRVSSKYDIDSLMQSPMVDSMAKIITARNLCTNRGNPIPESIELRYQEIVGAGGKLDMIAMGKLKLLDENGIPLRGRLGFAPGMKNLRVDRSYVNETVRVVTSISTKNDSTPLEQDTATRSLGGFDG
jgi:hypothetical protein